jgi:hypothetical protein
MVYMRVVFCDPNVLRNTNSFRGTLTLSEIWIVRELLSNKNKENRGKSFGELAIRVKNLAFNRARILISTVYVILVSRLCCV